MSPGGNRLVGPVGSLGDDSVRSGGGNLVLSSLRSGAFSGGGNSDGCPADSFAGSPANKWESNPRSDSLVSCQSR